MKHLIPIIALLSLVSCGGLQGIAGYSEGEQLIQNEPYRPAGKIRLCHPSGSDRTQGCWYADDSIDILINSQKYSSILVRDTCHCFRDCVDTIPLNVGDTLSLSYTSLTLVSAQHERYTSFAAINEFGDSLSPDTLYVYRRHCILITIIPEYITKSQIYSRNKKGIICNICPFGTVKEYGFVESKLVDIKKYRREMPCGSITIDSFMEITNR